MLSETVKEPSAGASSPHHLLLVEDNPGDARLIEAQLQDELDRSFELTSAASLEEAILRTRTREPDLVLLDLGLPDASGLEGVRRMREQEPAPPVVVLTGLDDEELALEALGEGAQDYLVKGRIDPGGLRRAIRYSLERHRAARELERTREEAEAHRALAQSILRSLPDHIAVLDEEGVIVAVNEAWRRFASAEGGGSDGYEGRNYLEVTRRAADQDDSAREMLEGLRSVLAGDRDRFSLEYPCHGPRVKRWFRASVTPLREAAIEGAVVSHADITDRKIAEQELRHRVLHDELTGLPNRTLFRDRLDRAWARARRRDQTLGVLMVDLSRFKRINDSLGHTAGDRVLQEVARRLESAVREEDTVARWGGDEFAVVLPELAGPEGLESVRDRLVRSLREPLSLAGERIEVEVSIGAVLECGCGAEEGVRVDSAEELVRYADAALRQAKRPGPTAFHLYDPERDGSGTDVLRREQELRRGLEAGEFEPFYQPIVDLETGSLWGLEPLARWRHPERGIVGPEEFISLAEETDLIHELGRRIGDRAIRDVAVWTEETGRPIRVTPNVSGRQFEDECVVSQLEACLADTGLDPSLVHLEVTETSVMRATSRLEELRRLGVRVQIDDFGTGYSSLVYLRDLDVDGLKIDMSFVQGLDGGTGNAAIVRTILTLAEELELDVVAEGIETEDQRRRLLDMGCTLGQGYLFARPMSAEAMDAYLAGSR